MTVSAQNVMSGPYVGNGSSTAFSLTFDIVLSSDVAVYQTDDAGVTTTLVLDTDYTVDGLGGPSYAQIVLTDPLESGYGLFMKSSRALTQSTSFPSQGPFFPLTHEAALDKLTYIAQESADILGKAVRLSDSESGGALSALPPAADRAGKYLAFDGSGDILLADGAPVPATAVSGCDVVGLDNIADAVGGDVVCIQETTLAPFTLQDLTFDPPITLKAYTVCVITASVATPAVAGALGSACIYINNCDGIIIEGFETTGDASTGIQVYESDDITVYNNDCHDLNLFGIYYMNCNNVLIDTNTVYSVGQELIHVGLNRTGAFDSWIIRDNVIYNSGLSGSALAEGILVGQAASQYLDFGPVTNVLVEDNTIYDIKAEAVDVKSQVQTAIIRRNTIYDIEVPYDAAITVGAADYVGPDSRYDIYNNTITNVTNRGAYVHGYIAVGHGDAYVYNNSFVDVVDSALRHGIQMLDFASNTTTNNLYVYGNTFLGTFRSENIYEFSSTNGPNTIGSAPLTLTIVPNQTPMLWLDASDTDTLTLSGNDVIEWADQSPNLYPVGQADTGARPTSGVRSINSLNALSFNGVDQFLSITNGPQLVINSMVFIVATLDDSVSDQRVLDFSDGGVTAIAAGILSDEMFFVHGEGATFLTVDPATGNTLIAAYKNGASLYVAAQGLTSTSSDGLVERGVDSWEIGAYNDGVSKFFDGALGEIRVYDYYDAGEFAAIRSELSTKWAISNPAPGPDPTGAPVITRSHTANATFVAPGNTLTLTYTSDIACYWQELVCPDNTTVYISANGLSCTLSAPISATAAWDSCHIGVSAWVYGNDSTELVTDTYDLYHVGKAPGDIVEIGQGTAYPILQDGIEQSGISAGATYVVLPGTYNNIRDTLMIGWTGSDTNTATPNGVSTGVLTVNVYGAEGQGITGTESIKDIDKFTTIISLDPMDAILDRQYRYGSMRILGNYRAGNLDGFRETFGIKIKGFSLRNCFDEPNNSRTDGCTIEMYSVINDTNNSDFVAANGADTPWYMDGGQSAMASVRNGGYEYFNIIGNNRFGMLIGRYAPQLPDACKHVSVKKGFITNACTQARVESHTQALTGYGSRHANWFNIMSIDSAEFKDGARSSLVGAIALNPNYAFICTNHASDDNMGKGLISINDIRGGFYAIQSNLDFTNTFSDCIAWKKVAFLNEWTFMSGDNVTFDRITAGRNGDLDTINRAGSVAYGNASDTMTNILALYPSWDYAYGGADKIFGNIYATTVDDNLTLIPSTLTLNVDYTGATNVNYSDLADGIIYAMRIEKGSTLYARDVGCQDPFLTYGTTGALFLDETDAATATDINWMSRSPWRLFRRERATYSCTVSATEYVGNVAGFADDNNPVDYMLSHGPSPTIEFVTPPVEDIKVYDNGTNPVLLWRPLAPAYRTNVTAYDLWVDGVVHTTGLSKSIFSYEVTGLAAGAHTLQLKVQDSVTGTSGLSRPVSFTV